MKCNTRTRRRREAEAKAYNGDTKLNIFKAGTKKNKSPASAVTKRLKNNQTKTKQTNKKKQTNNYTQKREGKRQRTIIPQIKMKKRYTLTKLYKRKRKQI